MLNTCSDSNSQLKYGSNFMPSNFLHYFKSLIIIILNGAFVSSSFADVLLELPGILLTSQKFNQCSILLCNHKKQGWFWIWKVNALMGPTSFLKWYKKYFSWMPYMLGSTSRLGSGNDVTLLAERWYQRHLFILKTTQHFVHCKYFWFWLQLQLLVNWICIASWLWNTDHLIKISSFIS